MKNSETTIVSRENKILSSKKLYSISKNICYLSSFSLLASMMTLIVYASDNLVMRVGSSGIWGALIFLLSGLVCKARLDHISSIELYRRKNGA